MIKKVVGFLVIGILMITVFAVACSNIRKDEEKVIYNMYGG